ncbi:MAG: nitroreductase family protein [Armatimonadetes bacterium]|nr:nitroreductase family protein [Armatimonadota bacterium]
MNTEELLTTTRSVRKRMDLARSVDYAIIERCLEIAIQAPSGSNQQKWHWLVITDPDKKRAVADLYRKSFDHYLVRSQDRDGVERARQSQMLDSAVFLAEHMHEVPVLVLACIEGRVEDKGVAAQASLYGSILPAAWSFMLALRLHGVGAAWTTLHLVYERETAALLGIPENVTQAVLLPVAHYRGDSFKPAARESARTCTYWNNWGENRS